METQIPSATPDSVQLAIIQKKLFLDNKIRGSVNWFFWIAGLSMVNTISFLMGNSLTFVIGLGATQIIDGFMFGLANELGAGWNVARFVGFAMDIFIAGVFVVFGVLGRKRYRAPIIIGMILYAIDGVILLLFQDFFGAGFHAFALFGIGSSLKSISELENLEKTGNVESIESIRQRMPSLQPQVTPQQRRLRWILVGLILLVILFFVGGAFLQQLF